MEKVINEIHQGVAKQQILEAIKTILKRFGKIKMFYTNNNRTYAVIQNKKFKSIEDGQEVLLALKEYEEFLFSYDVEDELFELFIKNL